MSHRAYTTQSTRKTPQGQPIPGREQRQVKNSAGGHAFPVDDWVRLDRFLVLGSEGGSYYATEQALTAESAQAVRRCIDSDGPRVVQRVCEISHAGRAPKNDPALFALAMCAGANDEATRAIALMRLPQVARIGTHLFHFVEYVKQFRGWGRGLRRAVANWYTSKEPGPLAYQLVKYQQRDGWSHRDLLRLSHPVAEGSKNTIFRWAAQHEKYLEHPHEAEKGVALLNAYDEAKTADKSRLLVLIHDRGLTREMIPTEWLNDPQIWRALLVEMPLTALIRNLGNLSKCGLLKQGAWAVVEGVCARVTDEESLRKARVHPLGVLIALKTYAQGHGMRGKGEWDVVPDVVDALDKAFYLAFGNVESTGKRWVIGLDVSGSMGFDNIAGMPITPREAAAALSMVTYRTEKQVALMAFSDTFMPLQISREAHLQEVVDRTADMPFSGTDCALPMLWALENGVEADAFMVLTDSETWAGDIHPCQALAQYRQEMGIPARLVVVGMVSNGFSIADPDDGGMMDVVGFDTATPNIIADFVVQA